MAEATLKEQLATVKAALHETRPGSPEYKTLLLEKRRIRVQMRVERLLALREVEGRDQKAIDAELEERQAQLLLLSRGRAA